MLSPFCNIPKQLQDARFRAAERFMFETRILLMVIPLITYATMNLIYSVVPVGLV